MKKKWDKAEDSMVKRLSTAWKEDKEGMRRRLRTVKEEADNVMIRG